MHASIDRMLAMQPQAMYLTHYSRITEVDRLGADLHRLIDTMVAVAQAARGDGVARHVEILAGLEQIMREEAARQNWALNEDETLDLLRMDLELNAQGLGVWLDSQRVTAAETA
ncbi:MBL fold metallo-hydrolase [Thauera mechernichensis]